MGLLLWWKPFNPDDVATIETLIAAGKVKPAIDRRFPLSEVVEALRWVERRARQGQGRHHDDRRARTERADQSSPPGSETSPDPGGAQRSAGCPRYGT